jgi:DNA-binding HxlR family transcriptional regulator
VKASRRSYDRFCPLSLALDVVGDRWTLLIIYGLLRGPLRYSDLDTFVSGAGSSLLTDRLRRLIEAGLVSRSAHASPGSPTVYQLTPAGFALAPVLQQLSLWGLDLLIPADPSSLPPEERVFNQAWTDPDAGVRADETYQWSIDGREFHFVVDGDRVTQHAGPAENPTVTMACSEEIFRRRVRGEIDWPTAIESGEVQIKGPTEAIERMLRITGLD